MTASKALPARPSLDSLRKQAKKLARDRSLTIRDAQLVLAREYGFAGWQDLTAEVNKRLGSSLDWAIAQARRVIHDNDVERLKQLIAEHPSLLAWHSDEDRGGLLGMATDAYGDCFDPGRERNFTRAACAELLIDAGAVVMPSVMNGLLESRARALMQMFLRKGLLPRSLEFMAALGDLDAIRAALRENGNDLATVNEAFIHACRFVHENVATLLLDRSITLDAELGRHIDHGPGRAAFVDHFVAHKPDFVKVSETGLWRGFVMERIGRALRDGDLASFVDGLRREAWTLSDTYVTFQVRLIEVATLNGRGEFITALLDFEPAILRRQPPPPSQAIEFAFTYVKTHLLPLLLRIWRLPDDLPHAAGNGDLARVKRWFDTEGKPALGDVTNHAPATSVHPREPQWGGVGVQQVLDNALAWSVLNHHFDVADFLLEHGADINTRWNSHEPASILHTLVFEDDYEAMQYLIDRGIDMTIEDYRWKSDARGWARHGKSDEKMAQWLEDAARRRTPPATSS